MENFLLYVFEASLAMLLFYLVYNSFLKNETFFRLNRAYLLLSLVFSLIFPFIKFTFLNDFFPGKTIQISLPDVVISRVAASSGSQDLSLTGVFTIVYLAITALLLLKFFLSLFQILKLKISSKVQNFEGYKIVAINKAMSPFSFFRSIFVSDKKIDEQDFERILAHERVHIREFHTLDIIFSEIIIAFFWINPFAWLYKKAVMEVHEYLADKDVYSRERDVSAFQSLLISQVFGGYKISLSNNFNNSLIKRRIKMMTKKLSGKPAYFKYLLIIPAFLFFFVISEAIQLTGTQALATNEKKEYTVKGPGSNKNVGADVAPKLDMSKLAKAIVYPEDARKSGKEGKVILKVKVSKKGLPVDITVVESSDKIFENSAITAMKKMKFKPAKVNNKPVETEVHIPVQYKLK